MPPGPSLVPVLSPRLSAVEPEDLRLLAAVDGARALPELAAAAGLDPVRASAAVGRLVAAGLLDVALPGGPAAGPPAGPAAERPASPAVQDRAPAAGPALPALAGLRLPDGPAAAAPAAEPVPPAGAPAADADTSALLRELSLLHVTTPSARPGRTAAPAPEPPAPQPAAAGAPRRRGLFGR